MAYGDRCARRKALGSHEGPRRLCCNLEGKEGRRNPDGSGHGHGNKCKQEDQYGASKRQNYRNHGHDAFNGIRRGSFGMVCGHVGVFLKSS